MLALMPIGLAHTPVMATGLEGLTGWFAWLLGGDSWRHVQLPRASVLRLQAQGWHLKVLIVWPQGTTQRHSLGQVSATPATQVGRPLPLPLVYLEIPKVPLLTLPRAVTS